MKHPQSRGDSSTLMDTLYLHEILFCSELRQEFSELCSSFTTAMQNLSRTQPTVVEQVG